MHSSFLPTFALTALSQSPAPGANPVRAFGKAGPRWSLALPLVDPQGWQ